MPQPLVDMGDHEGLARAHLLSASLHWLQARGDDTAAEARLAAQHASQARDNGLRDQALRTHIAGLWFGSAPASRIAQELDHLERERLAPFLAVEIDLVRVELARFAGSFEEALDVLQRAIDTYRALGRRGDMAATGMPAGHIHLVSGDAAAAVDVLLRNDTVLAELGERSWRSTFQAFLAQAYEELGNSDQARGAIALAETLGGPDDILNYVITHRVRARLALREGNRADAERWARSAVKHANMTDSIDEQGYARLTLAHVLASLGRHQEAGQEASAASELFTAKGNEFARAQAQTMLGQLASMSAFVE